MKIDKRTLRIVGIVIATVFVVVAIIPTFINVESFKPKIESELTNALGRPVTLGKLSLSIFSGSVTVDDLSIADDPAFSKSPFVTAKSLKVGVELIPLIFSKQLNITGITLQEPQITLLKARNGKWNFSSLGATSKTPATAEKSGLPQQLSVDKLQVKTGKIAVGNADSSTKPQVYENVAVEVTNFSATSQFPFELTTDLPGGGSAKIEGKAGPINASDSAKTPLEASVVVKDLKLAASGFVTEASGIDGLVELEGKLNSNGSEANAVGTIACKKLKLSPKGTPASETVKMNYALDADLNANTVTVTEGDIAIGKASAKLTGRSRTQGDTQALNLRLSAPDMAVDEIEAMLPAMGVTLPSGSKLKGGTISADLAITGTLEQMVISGPVRMSNTKLAGFDMGEKLSALSAIAGKSPSGGGDTAIQNASLNARIAPEMTRADSINVTVSSLGVVTGAGTVSPSGNLDFRMTADLQAAKGSGIPFMVQGTTSHPTFVPDVAGIAEGAIKGAIGQKVGGKDTSNPIGAVTGLFGKKKK